MLTIVATPIGNWDDITLRAKSALAAADVIIGEEHRAASTLLKKIGLPQKEIYLLNEHSKKDDITELADLCAEKNAVLISDCGTPGFCDPGAKLVKALRNKKVKITSLPGPSSLMTLISLSSWNLKEFRFLGFLPVDRAEREKKWREISAIKEAQVLMDTPYRLEKFIDEINLHFSDRSILLALNLSMENEFIYDGPVRQIKDKTPTGSHEFMALIYPKISE